MSDRADEARRLRIERLNRMNDALVERVKAGGLTVRPTHLDKLSHPRGVFNRGRKQTI